MDNNILIQELLKENLLCNRSIRRRGRSKAESEERPGPPRKKQFQEKCCLFSMPDRFPGRREECPPYEKAASTD